MKINTTMHKPIYILLIWLCTWVATSTCRAQVYSTTTYKSSNSQPSLFTTRASSQSFHSFGGGAASSSGGGAFHSSIRTVASTVSGGVLVDNVGYIPSKPKSIAQSIMDATTDNTTGNTNNSGNGYIDDDTFLPPPMHAPLGMGWDTILLMLILATAYTLYITRKAKRALSKKSI